MIALPSVLPRISDSWTKSGLLFLSIGFTAALGIVYLIGGLKWPALPAPQGRWLRLQPIYDIARVSRHMFQSRTGTVVPFGYSLVVNTVNAIIFFLLLHDLGAVVSLFDCLVLVPIIIQVSLLPISIGGWGVRESVAVIGFGYFGVSGEVALASSVIFGFLMLVFSLYGGVLWWIDFRSESAAAKRDLSTSKNIN
jgi:uncharacterized membrane protein YbhN (UPF0104 family)